MHEHTYADDRRWWRDEPPFEPFGRPRPAELDRLTHLVLVDGRLVEAWSEPVAGTRWQTYADRFDGEHRPVEPPTPPWEHALEWLREVCGGRDAVSAMTADPLPDPLEDEACRLPLHADPSARGRLEATADLLQAVAERWFDDPEMSPALRRALLLVWEESPETVLRARSAAHLAGGLCWAVGKANACFRPQGDLTMARVQEALGLTAAISGYGASVRSALVGFRHVDHHRWWRPDGIPTIEALGRADLLTSTTRKRLLRVRERAVAAQAAAA